MTAVALDTFEIVKELRAAGFNDAQAEAVTYAVKRAQASNTTELATKADLKAEIADVRREIGELKAEFANKLLTVVGLQTIVILGGVAGLLRLLQP